MWKILAILAAALSLSACGSHPPADSAKPDRAPAVREGKAAPVRRTGSSGPLLSGSQIAAAVASHSYDMTADDGSLTRISYGADGALTVRSGGQETEGGWAVGGDALSSGCAGPAAAGTAACAPNVRPTVRCSGAAWTAARPGAPCRCRKQRCERFRASIKA